MPLFLGVRSVVPKRKTKGKAAAMAKASVRSAAAKPTPGARFSVMTFLPRSIRSRLLVARTTKPAAAAPAPKPASGWTVGSWLGGAAAALSSVVHRPGKPRAADAAGAVVRSESPTLYLDARGAAHLGTGKGDDRTLYKQAIREMQAAGGKRVSAPLGDKHREPDMAATRRAARASFQREPRVQRQGKRAPKGGRLLASRQQFQPAQR
ncbi:hypothetical protein Rsub_12078 [Raphidocelis subcapitata]|uniref:Uncharacterized protein n=1 Tax=Raphidocelis subcapitata TaxID=307507 RepID=A0A2V0PPB3_9CHLO|nr:hypothetical protein Rsub_12078 [Raphidocelis subcapitata]|eukprot:GBF99297.1 hypothetical protein Rsub_12078 [Raphidocelis subcapitata]